MDTFSVASGDCGQTDRIAAVLARHLAGGDVVLLKGRLATGKTMFVKATAKALGSSQLVTSPTFTLAHFYSSIAASILHIDAYRLAGIHEYRDLGLDEYICESIVLIEWGDKIAEDFPCHLMIEFRCDVGSPDQRTLELSSRCSRWTQVMDRLRTEILYDLHPAGADS
jgi:tRNA threonylcarbamoyladenosine biosynthesis protein TsaE